MEFPVQLQQRIINFLINLPNIDGLDSQKALIFQAELDPKIRINIPVNLPRGQFILRLVEILIDYDGRYSLEAILKTAADLVGQDKRAVCETLLEELRLLPVDRFDKRVQDKSIFSWEQVHEFCKNITYSRMATVRN